MKMKAALPDANRLSIVTAIIMLAFALTKLISYRLQNFYFSIFGIFIGFSLDFDDIVILFSALLAGFGMNWLLQSHPEIHRYQNHMAYVAHWIVPVLTALVIGATLKAFAVGLIWWVVYGMGSLLLFAVFIAEYSVVTHEDYLNPIATVGLTALSFGLFLLLVIALFDANIRLYVRLPLMWLGALMVIARTLYLRLGKWHLLWALLLSLVISEVVVGLNYLPLSPIKLSVLLLGIAYTLTSLVTAMEEGRKSRALWGEPISMLVITILISIFWG